MGLELRVLVSRLTESGLDKEMSKFPIGENGVHQTNPLAIRHRQVKVFRSAFCNSSLECQVWNIYLCSDVPRFFSSTVQTIIIVPTTQDGGTSLRICYIVEINPV